MDQYKIKVGYVHDDSQLLHCESIQNSPRNQFFALGGLFGFQPTYFKSPLDEPQVLSQSLTFNALEDIECKDDDYRPNHRVDDCDFHKPASVSKLCINGKSYTPCFYMNVDDLASLNKRESVTTLDTVESGETSVDNSNSLSANEERRTVLRLDAFHLDADSAADDHISTELLNRRHTSFNLRKFNSFGSTLLQRSRTENSDENASKRINKKITKDSNNTKPKTRRSRKTAMSEQAKSQNLNIASCDNIDLFSNQDEMIDSCKSKKYFTESVCAIGGRHASLNQSNKSSPSIL